MHLFISIQFKAILQCSLDIKWESVACFSLKTTTKAKRKRNETKKSFSSSEITEETSKMYKRIRQQHHVDSISSWKLEIMSRCDYCVRVYLSYHVCVCAFVCIWSVEGHRAKNGEQKMLEKIILRIIYRCFKVTVFVCIFTFLCVVCVGAKLSVSFFLLLCRWVILFLDFTFGLRICLQVTNYIFTLSELGFSVSGFHLNGTREKNCVLPMRKLWLVSS